MPTPHPRPASTAARALEPLVGILWLLFLLWTLLVAGIWFLNLGDAQLTAWFSRPDPATGERVLRNVDLVGALRAVLGSADTIWLALGMANVYLALVRQAGLANARRWALLIFASAWIIGALSVWANLPLGPLRFTPRLGFKIGPVSVGWMLLWFCTVIGAREFVRALAGKASHAVIAVMTGALLGVISIPLEIVGWKLRSWWLWYPGQVPAPSFPPAMSFVVWALAGAILSLAMRDGRVTQSVEPGLGRASAVFLCIVALLGVALGTASS